SAPRGPAHEDRVSKTKICGGKVGLRGIESPRTSAHASFPRERSSATRHQRSNRLLTGFRRRLFSRFSTHRYWTLRSEPCLARGYRSRSETNAEFQCRS